MSPLIAILAVVALQRWLELCYAHANTRRLLARGAVESGRAHYPLFVVLHAGWLAVLATAVPPATVPRPELLVLLAALMIARLWVMASLGRWWTTRIISLPGAPLVRRGPYRLFRHPNYLVVAGEIAVLPLAFDALAIAVTFSILNGMLLAIRIASEEAALSARETIAAAG
jgi:methyltransferase